MKRVIRLGDPTTHGGTVVSASSTTIIFGKPVARMGDKATCPIPGHGVVTIVEGDENWLDDGKPISLEGHKCSCGCSLISTLPNVLRSNERTGATRSATGAVSPTEAAGNPAVRFNERFQLHDDTGTPAVRASYGIQRASGDIEYGITDSQGCTHLLSDKEEAEVVNVYFLGYENE